MSLRLATHQRMRISHPISLRKWCRSWPPAMPVWGSHWSDRKSVNGWQRHLRPSIRRRPKVICGHVLCSDINSCQRNAYLSRDIPFQAGLLGACLVFSAGRIRLTHRLGAQARTAARSKCPHVWSKRGSLASVVGRSVLLPGSSEPCRRRWRESMPVQIRRWNLRRDGLTVP